MQRHIFLPFGALNDAIVSKLDAAKVLLNGDTNAKVEFDFTSGGSFVIRFYSNYTSASSNYGHQIVLTQSNIRYDAITNGAIQTIWTK